MKYLIEATGRLRKGRNDYGERLVPVEIVIDGERENTSIIFSLPDGRDWWIPITELDHLMYIINGLTKEE